MSNLKFLQCLEDFKKSKDIFICGKREFERDVIDFMKSKGFPVKVLFFDTSFGVDIDHVRYIDSGDIPYYFPLNVLVDFCNYFGCEFKYTTCEGSRYIFGFNGLSMRW